jgi:hypothetical protein
MLCSNARCSSAQHGTARSKHRFPYCCVFGREAFSDRLPSKALLRNPTMGWHVTLLLLLYLYGIGCLACSHSESINSEFLIPQTVGKSPWTDDQPVARPLPTQDNRHRIKAGIHSASGIRTHNPNLLAGKGISCPATTAIGIITPSKG